MLNIIPDHLVFDFRPGRSRCGIHCGYWMWPYPQTADTNTLTLHTGKLEKMTYIDIYIYLLYLQKETIYILYTSQKHIAYNHQITIYILGLECYYLKFTYIMGHICEQNHRNCSL